MSRPRSVGDPISVDDLVLSVSEDVDPLRFSIGPYDAFLDRLVGERYFQREALEVTLRYLLGNSYSSVKDLGRASFESSDGLRRYYGRLSRLIDSLPFPDMLSCSLDLATATGKSYILYGIARIMLNEGAVDRVLLLSPSLTIERGLREKFEVLTAASDLTDLLPERPGARIPDIVDAAATVGPGQICIENIHATYERTGSSIEDSFAGHGESTLVMSDEAHHIHSPQGKAMKRWQEFIQSDRFGFRYHVGVSGTCYVGNDYFSDVVYRYSIGQAIDDGVVKEIFYLEEDDSRTDDERFQKLLAQHERSRALYGMKPITIAVTKNINAAERLAEDLIEFLSARLGEDRGASAGRVLTVTSSPKHADSVRRLATVDEDSDPVEWIVSVAMLSEGWDVSRVFQIYPHEKRAFNSKLLIAQVLGRGLRVPQMRKGGHPVVRVFNHQKWGPEVEELVSAVIDQDDRITQRSAARKEVPQFELHLLEFDEVPTGLEASELPRQRELKKLTLHPQKDAPEETRFRSAADPSRTDVLTTRVTEKLYPLEEVVSEVRKRLREHDQRTGGDLAERYTRERIEALIEDAFRRLELPSTWVSQENRQIILSSFGSLRQRTSRPGAVLTSEPVGLVTLTTEQMPPTRARVSAVTSTLGVFVDSQTEALSGEDDRAALQQIREMSQQVPTFLHEVPNTYLFKSPTNLVLASHRPEREFVSRLFKDDNAANVHSWVKAPDVGFYTIEFSYQGRSGGTKRSSFSPDFFLLLKSGDVAVVETKADGDDSPANSGKLKYAKRHFSKVNALLRDQGQTRQYLMHFLSPLDYDRFFEALRAEELDQFVSALQASLRL